MRHYIMPAAILMLGACGGSEQTGEDLSAVATDGQPADLADAGQAKGTAAAEKLNCATVKGRKPQGPDILGITIGMAERPSFEALACAMPDAIVESRDFEDGTRNYNIKDETGNILVLLSGALDDRRVVSISRHMKFAAGEGPIRENFRKQMADKYGDFSSTESDRHYDAHRLIKTVDGTPLAPAHPLYQTCQNYLADPQCGFFVRYQMSGYGPDGTNDTQLAEAVSMEMTHVGYAIKQKDILAASVEAENRKRVQQERDNAAGNKPDL